MAHTIMGGHVQFQPKSRGSMILQRDGPESKEEHAKAKLTSSSQNTNQMA